jgi:MraZ protein
VEFYLYLYRLIFHGVARYNLIGEFECRVDDKCRIILPSGLKKQIRPEAKERFAVTRGFDGSMLLFPFDAWEDFNQKYDDIDLFDRESRWLIRFLRTGATESQLDGQNRLLLPKRLLEEVNIERDVVLLAYHDRVEIWDKQTYLEKVAVRPDNLEEIAERVLSKKNRKEAGDGVS